MRRIGDGPVIDAWTAVHVATGAWAAGAGVPWQWALGGAVAYEVIEHVWQKTEHGKRFWRVDGPEPWANKAADVAVFMAGFSTIRALSARRR